MSSWGWKDGDDRALEFPDETTPTPAPKKGPGQEGRGRIIYQNDAQQFRVSTNGSPYVPLGIGAPGANTQLDWYIDPVNGSDSRKGDTIATAIKTHEELRNRIGRQLIDVDMVIHLLNDFDASNPIFCDFTFGVNGTVRYIGEKTPTVLYSGSFTATAGFDRLNNKPVIVTDTALPVGWSASDLLNSFDAATRRMRLTSGPFVGAVAYPFLEDSGDPKSALTTPFGFKTETFFTSDPLYRIINADLANFPFGPATLLADYGQPAVGTTFVVEADFTQVEVFVCTPQLSGFLLGYINNRASVLVNDIEFCMLSLGQAIVTEAPTNTFGAPVVFFSGCGIGSIANMLGTISLDFCRAGASSSDPFGVNQSINARGGRMEVSASLLAGPTVIEAGAMLALWADGVQAFDTITVQGRLECRNAGFFGWGATYFGTPPRGSGAAIYVRPGGIVETTNFFGVAPQAAIYGESTIANTKGVRFDAGGHLAYLPVGADAAASVTVTAPLGDYDLTGVFGTWALTVDDVNAAKLAGVSANS